MESLVDSVMEPESPKHQAEPLKYLPVIYMCSTIAFLYVVYVTQHRIPRMQLDVEEQLVDRDVRMQGQLEMVVFHVITVMLTICYARAVWTKPGTIPEGDRKWDYQAEDYLSFLPSFLKETKRSGDRRHCKWCGKFKPDRAHHCRTCKQCTLKMDHHCPWIYNCVGYFNYKWFFLLVFYSVLNLNMVTWTMADTVSRILDVPTPLLTMFLIFFAQTLAVGLNVLVSGFFALHIYLLARGMSTIEFCEKATKETVETEVSYDLGLYGNVSAVLGDQPLLWLLPVRGPTGDGLSYVREDISYDELEATKTMLRAGKGRRQERGACGDAVC